MKVKTYEGIDEQVLLNNIKDELGNNALILSIKKTKPKGIFAFFRKEKVIITAAIDSAEEVKPKNSAGFNPANKASVTSTDKENLLSFIENFQQNIKNTTDKKDESPTAMEKLDLVDIQSDIKENKSINKKIADNKENNVTLNKYDNEFLEIIYNTLIEENVLPEVAKSLVDMAEKQTKDTKDKNNINSIIKIVYNNIIELVSFDNNYTLDYSKAISNFNKILVFMGPTGVGKTTTIAKIASNLVIDQKAKVGLITSDTYRIAATKQLQTYAEILEVDMETVFNQEDISNAIISFKESKDYILIDTAGRSHKNPKNIEDLNQIISVLDHADKFLVISLTTKNSDLKNIIDAYGAFSDYKVIFTKADETDSFGAILNVCFLTGKKATFITNGQNVPNDISVINPERVAKSLLGLEVEEIW